MKLFLSLSLIFLCLSTNAEESLYILEQSDTTGSFISVPIGVTGFDNIISLQGSILFDPSVLLFDSIGSFNVPGLNISSFGLNQTGFGIITYSWHDASLQGETLLDSTILFNLKFVVFGTAGQGCLINFSSSPTLQEVVDSSLLIKSFLYNGMYFLIDDIFLNNNDGYCKLSVFPNIILKNNFVKINYCNEKESIIVFDFNGRIDNSKFKICNDKLFFFYSGWYFIKLKDRIKKVLII